jgi:AraC-like DNA-binding protein
MIYTALDNSDIAIRLNYSEESSMARDFRKELGLSPKETRRQLQKYHPREILRI